MFKMTTKQEKLAAARRKLKEFQGKQKDSNIKHKVSTDILSENSSLGNPSVDSSPRCTPVSDDNKYDSRGVYDNVYANQNLHIDSCMSKKLLVPLSPKSESLSEKSEQQKEFNTIQKSITDNFSVKLELSDPSVNSSPRCTQPDDKLHHETGVSDSVFDNSKLLDPNISNTNLSDPFLNKSKILNNFPKNKSSEDFELNKFFKNLNFNKNNSEEGNDVVKSTTTSSTIYANELNTNNSVLKQPLLIKDQNHVNCPTFIGSQNPMGNKANASSSWNYCKIDQFTPEKTFVNKENEFPNMKGFCNNGTFSDVIIPLQTELQNHAQTIGILVQQKNDVQNALAETQNLLSKQSGELEQQKQYISYLNSSVDDLNKKILEKESIIQELRLDLEKKKHLNNETTSNFQSLQLNFDLKEEECKEFKRKCEEKNKECQQLMYRLNEAQSQLSLYQIQIQQLTTGENASLNIKVSELQIDKLNLEKKINNLKKELDAVNTDREQSSEQFRDYVEECNTQIANLNSQLESLTVTNKELTRENKKLSHSLYEIENSKKLAEDDLDSKSEIADLHSQISVLSEANAQLNNDCQKLQLEISVLQKIVEEKEKEIQNTAETLREARMENKKLLTEIETPKPNERLLAAIESDKVAAAKAVSQNQKLKTQVVELEEAFMKLSEEKLKLTNQLAYEQHINKELLTRVEALKSYEHGSHYHDHDNEHMQISNSNSQCVEEHHSKTIEPLVNDSNEIEELRSIIRQLQDDKMELKTRLNVLASRIDEEFREKPAELVDMSSIDVEINDENSNENSKVRLQQMEQKLKKTMNEIAKLDEEKEKLEHLVMQLQGETETIGEYVTLYQKQRMLLRQRAKEKDVQLQQLCKDKEELKLKLVSLEDLVQHLLKDRSISCLPTDMNSPIVQASTIASPLGEFNNENIATKIQALITEIRSTSLVNNNSTGFEHCSCCSGSLITI